jgi:phage shock protein PspC (stress-responsive transcriptional regulator)
MLSPVSGTQGNQRQATLAGVEDTIKDFWATRPTRPRAGRVVAGVAAGIGRRFGIDPVIVRVALVVAAVFGGSGILFYLLGWLFLAAEEDQVSPFEGMIGRGRSSASTGFTVVLCLLLIPASSFVWGGHLSTVLGALVVLGGLYLLHRGRSGQGQVVPPGSTAPMTGAPSTNSAMGATMNETVTDEQPAGPPAWDPLGAAPFAWDLPDPNAAPPPPPAPAPRPAKRPRSKATPITLAVAIITAGGLYALSPALGGWATWQHVVGVVLGVLGLGMVAGSFVRGGRGLIGLGVVLAAVGVLGTAVHIDRWNGIGDTTYRPTSITAVQPAYERSLGDLTLDFTGLGDQTGTITTKVDTTAGNVHVFIPAGAKVVAHCSTTAGSVNCLGDQQDGTNAELTSNQAASTGPGSGLVIDITAQSTAGDVEVDSQ